MQITPFRISTVNIKLLLHITSYKIYPCEPPRTFHPRPRPHVALPWLGIYHAPKSFLPLYKTQDPTSYVVIPALWICTATLSPSSPSVYFISENSGVTFAISYRRSDIFCRVIYENSTIPLQFFFFTKKKTIFITVEQSFLRIHAFTYVASDTPII